MSNRELAKDLIDQIPESRMYYVISYLQGAAISDETTNAETIASIEELENGGGTLFIVKKIVKSFKNIDFFPLLAYYNIVTLVTL